MNRKQAETLLASLILIRTTAYLFSKNALRTLDKYSLLGVRFTMAFLILLLLFHKQMKGIRKKTVFHGILMGTTYFFLMIFEYTALKIADVSVVSFLENTSIIFVPVLLTLIHHRLPAKQTILSVLLSVVGVFFLTMNGGSLTFGAGELCSLGAALMSAVTIIITGHFAQTEDGLQLGIIEIGTMGVYGLVSSLMINHHIALPSTSSSRISVLALVFLCTVIGYTFQPVAQRYVSAEKTGILTSLNPLFATVLGVFLLHEQMTTNRLIGIAFVLSGLVVTLKTKKQKTSISVAKATPEPFKAD